MWSDLFDYGLIKIIDGRSTIWIQRELLFCDWRNYFPKLSLALCERFIARGGSLIPTHEENEQFFNGTAVDKVGRRTIAKSLVPFSPTLQQQPEAAQSSPTHPSPGSP